jgi:hypothetical protein
MRAPRLSLLGLGLANRRTRMGVSRRASGLALLALCAGVPFVAPAVATATKAPEYSLSIVEGETTLPEHPIANISGRAAPRASVAVSIIRGGTVVARSTGTEGGAWMSQVPQVGDLVTLESPVGSTVQAITYDGLPSMDPTVCAGSTNFSGQRSGALEVEGEHYLQVQHPSYVATRSKGHAQVTGLVGSSFSGNFLTPLALGETVRATEFVQTTLASGAIFSYSSETDRPVGACPAPPPPPPPPPPPLALQGSIFKFARTTIHRFLKSGWLDQVMINQPGTVVQDLYLKDGKLPAFASSRKGKHHGRKVVPAAQLVARGSTTAKSAGTVSVLIRVTAKGRRLLSHRKQVQMVLVTTLRSNTGAKLNLARRTVTLHR